MNNHPFQRLISRLHRVRLACLFGLALAGCDSAGTVEPLEPACQSDRFDNLDEPALLAIGRYDELVVCPGHVDGYRLEQAVGSRIRVQVDASAPVRVRFVGAMGVLEEAEGVAVELLSASEQLTHLEIEGDAEYALQIWSNVVDAPCAGRMEDADELGPGENLRGLCEGEDWFRISGRSGHVLRVVIDGNDGAARVALFETIEERPMRVDVGRYTQGSTIRFERIMGPEPVLWVRVLSTDSTGYGVRSEIEAIDVIEKSASGTIVFERKTVDLNGLSEPVEQPAAHIRFDVIVPQSGFILAAGLTDEAGRFDLTFQQPPGTEAALRVVADARSPRTSVRVGPETGYGVPWGRVLGVLDVDATEQDTWHVDSELSIAAALSIATTARDGLIELEGLLPVPTNAASPLHYRWVPGERAPCSTCFVPGAEAFVQLSGQEPDPDQWDDFVVLHEMGHYVSTVYGRDDSPGGRHDGSPTIPAVAWSEGLATYLSSVLMGTPEQLDYRDGGVRVLDIEELGDDVMLGTESGTPDGLVSEWLVAAMLWDLSDAPAGDDESVGLGFPAVIEPVFGPLAMGWQDRGAPGIDLMDYLDAFLCEGEGTEAVQEVAELHDFPYARTECMMKGSVGAQPSTEAAEAKYGVRSGVAHWVPTLSQPEVLNHSR